MLLANAVPVRPVYEVHGRRPYQILEHRHPIRPHQHVRGIGRSMGEGRRMGQPKGVGDIGDEQQSTLGRPSPIPRIMCKVSTCSGAAWTRSDCACIVRVEMQQRMSYPPSER